MISLTGSGLITLAPAVSPRLQVPDGRDNPIAGLHAAGSVGQGGLLLEGHGHHIGWIFVSGRIAGRNAATNVITGDLPGPG